jgi:phosphoglycerate dehydrogenase-like enzyme
MQAVNVLVTSQVSKENFRLISSASPAVNLKDASFLVRAELSGDDSGKAQLDALLGEAEVIYGCWSHRPGSDLPRNLVSRTPKLKWLHSMSAGVDSFLDPRQAAVTSNTGIVDSDIMLTGSAGIHVTAMAELVLENVLMFAKQAPSRFRWKQEKKWVEFVPALLHGQTIGILGMGLGGEVARLAQAFGMRVMATHRSARPGEHVRNVDVMLPRDQLPRLLAESDYVIVLLPLTPETYKMIGEKELRAMKPGAFLINVSRGNVVDEEALVRALEERWIAGAGLDVYAREPLPPESKLWELPNVILSAHVGGDFEGNFRKIAELFAENLKRYLSGKPLINLVDKKKGYSTSGEHYLERE